MSVAEKTAAAGEVYVETYHNLENGQSYTPYYASGGLASGTEGLGSEEDFIGIEFDPEEDHVELSTQGFFGADNYLADIAQEAIAPKSGDEQIDALLGGNKWGVNTITYSFYDDATSGRYYGGERGVREVSETVKENVRYILENIYESVIDVDFQEVNDTANSYGLLRIMLSDDPNYAYARGPFAYDYNVGNAQDTAGDVHLKPSYDNAKDTNGFQGGPGTHGFMTLIHELAHALGLKHPGDYNGNGTGEPPFLEYSEDNTTNTLMSYNFAGNPAHTLMPYDVKALQYLYGANDQYTGDTTYNFSSVTKYTVNGNTSHNTNNQPKQAIWDTSGTDTLDFSDLTVSSSGYYFDINEGGIITDQDAYLDYQYTARGDSSGNKYSTTTYGTALDYGAVIENVINSSSDDTIVANALANTFSGYQPGTSTGDDVIEGSNSQDTLDLSSYKSSDVTQTQNGNDLLIDLGGNGSIKIKDYYTGDTIKILLDDDEPTPDPDTGDRINITSPKSSSVLEPGSFYEITWNDNISEDVNIYLLKDGYYDRYIEFETPSDGSYSWYVPDDLTSDSTYEIWIESSTNYWDVYDFSDGFTISPATSGADLYYYTYHYDDNSDSYTGYFYEESGSYFINDAIYDIYGYYEIWDKYSNSGSIEDIGNVYIYSYYDGDVSGESHTPYYSDSYISGTTGLGSEWDYVYSDLFGYDYFGPDDSADAFNFDFDSWWS